MVQRLLCRGASYCRGNHSLFSQSGKRCSLQVRNTLLRASAAPGIIKKVCKLYFFQALAQNIVPLCGDLTVSTQVLTGRAGVPGTLLLCST